MGLCNVMKFLSKEWEANETGIFKCLNRKTQVHRKVSEDNGMMKAYTTYTLLELRYREGEIATLYGEGMLMKAERGNEHFRTATKNPNYPFESRK